MPLAGHGLRPPTLRRRAGRPQLKRDPLASHLVLRGAHASSLSIFHNSERSLVRQSVCRASFCIDLHPLRPESRRGMFCPFHAFKCKPVIGTRSEP